MARHSIAVYSARNTFLKYIAARDAQSLVESGAAHRNQGGLSITLNGPENSAIPIATTISLFEVMANAGCYGAPLEFLKNSCPVRRAQDKIQAWPDVHDGRAVIICAGKVHRPEIRTVPEKEAA